jgi:hypothetical protein
MVCPCRCVKCNARQAREEVGRPQDASDAAKLAGAPGACRPWSRPAAGTGPSGIFGIFGALPVSSAAPANAFKAWQACRGDTSISAGDSCAQSAAAELSWPTASSRSRAPARPTQPGWSRAGCRDAARQWHAHAVTVAGRPQNIHGHFLCPGAPVFRFAASSCGSRTPSARCPLPRCPSWSAGPQI